ncbi:alpha-glucosidase C-terminal domain-containing protein [Nonomuraea sp. B10E15]|uniref:alpha-glucosidase C-terminal domain-containing protein n=1 Tax=Nonomuraea sp. B10E15 TaxID=3153560 RepID=UPI00325E8D46
MDATDVHLRVFAHRCDAGGATMVIVHNLGDTACDVELTLPGLEGSRLTDLLVDGTLEVSGEGTVRVALDPHGCRWLRAFAPGASPENASAKAM